MAEDASSSLTEEAIAHLIREAPFDEELAALAEANSSLRQAAVLIPLFWEEDHWSLLFTRRTETVQSHKGQVSFPGGAADTSDDSLETTALREAFEEVGIPPGSVHLLGRLAVRPTISRYLVTPVVGRVVAPVSYLLSEREVSRVFCIPLGWLADPANWELRPRSTPGGFFERVIYYHAYDDEILWGATARMTHDLLRILRLMQ